MKTLFFIYRVFGRAPVLIILYPVISWFFLTNRVARESSRDYLRRLYEYSEGKSPKPSALNVFRHLYAFGECILDKLIIWSGRIDDLPYSLEGLEEFHSHANAGNGAIVAVSHLGNLDFCRAIGRLYPDINLTVLVHTSHAVKFNQLLKSINPESALNIIQVSKFSMHDAMLLSEKIEKGGLIAIAGDRVPLLWGNTVAVDFMGSKAEFPVGAYMLAKTLGCPLFSLISIKVGGKYELSCHKISELRGEDKSGSIQEAAQAFATRLEDGCLKSPFQWFNFYPFWQQGVNHE
jgi:predicted LPLAT superfamily acyltransferase